MYQIVSYCEFISYLQVLSSSVSKALKVFGGDGASETARFTALFDKCFDCVNVSRLAGCREAEQKLF